MKNELMTYINYMYKNSIKTEKGIEAPGITKISTAGIGISYKVARMIHGHLTMLGAIITKSKATIILKEKDDLIKILNKENI